VRDVLDLPTLEMPRALATAASTLAERRADLEKATRAREQGEAAIAAARAQDHAAYAAAQDARKADPGDQNERPARAALVELRRREEGEQLRYDVARETLLRALDEHGVAWGEKLGGAWRKADAAASAALDAFEEAERRRREVRTVALWLAASESSGYSERALARPLAKFAYAASTVPDADSSGAKLDPAALVEGLRTFIALSGNEEFVDHAPERDERRQREQTLERLRTSGNGPVMAAAHYVELGTMNLDEATQVEAGADLDEVIEQARERRAAERPTLVGW
jgi:hypothetical protein